MTKKKTLLLLSGNSKISSSGYEGNVSDEKKESSSSRT